MKAWYYKVIGRFWRWWYNRFSINGSPNVITHKQLYWDLQKIWPGVDIDIPDATYYLPTIEEFREKVISTWRYQDYRYVPELFDCDNFSVAFAAHADKVRLDDYEVGAVNPDERFEYPSGRIWGQNLMGLAQHSVTIFRMRTGYYLLEPQSHNHRPIDPSIDKTCKIRF